MLWKLFSYLGANIQLKTWRGKQEGKLRQMNFVLAVVHSQNSKNEATDIKPSNSLKRTNLLPVREH